MIIFGGHKNQLELTAIGIFFLIAASFLGCKSNEKPVHIQEHEKSVPEEPNDFSGEKFGFIQNIFQKDGNDFGSITFIDYKSKNKPDKDYPGKSLQEISDSLEVLEIPDGYFFWQKRKNVQVFKVDEFVKIKMQTLNYNSTGNFKFNESVDFARFKEIFSEKEFNRFKSIPFKIGINRNVIVSFIEQYIP